MKNIEESESGVPFFISSSFAKITNRVKLTENIIPSITDFLLTLRR